MATKNVELTGLNQTIQVPDGSRVELIQQTETPALPHWTRVLRRALQSPIQSPPLCELVAHANLVFLLIPDFTRRIPLSQVMSVLVDVLKTAGLDRHRLGIMVASATHRALEDEELEELVGLEVYKEFPVLNHDWRNDDSMVALGSFPDGTPIRVNDMIKDADLLIGVGQIRPHRIAGYTGGGKIVLPGISGPDALGWTHWLSAHKPSREFTHVVDNPIRHAMEKAAEAAGLRFIVNLVMNREGKVAGVFAGHPVAAHREGVRCAEKIYPCPDGRIFDIVLSLCPSDLDLWQAASGIYEGSLWVKQGGRLILWAPCPEGVAPHHPEVLQFGYMSLKDAQECIAAGKIHDLVVAAHLAHVGEILYNEARIALVSDGIDAKDTERLHLLYAKDIQTAVDQAYKEMGQTATMAIYCR